MSFERRSKESEEHDPAKVLRRAGKVAIATFCVQEIRGGTRHKASGLEPGQINHSSHTCSVRMLGYRRCIASAQSTRMNVVYCRGPSGSRSWATCWIPHPRIMSFHSGPGFSVLSNASVRMRPRPSRWQMPFFCETSMTLYTP